MLTRPRLALLTPDGFTERSKRSCRGVELTPPG